jgi:hypothetical protein
MSILNCSFLKRAAEVDLPKVYWEFCPDRNGSDGTIVQSYGKRSFIRLDQNSHILSRRLVARWLFPSLVIVFFCGCDKSIDPIRYDIDLDISVANAQHPIALMVFNPLPNPAKLVGFRSTCACGNPDFQVAELPARRLVSIAATLDTTRIQRSTQPGSELVLEPILELPDQTTVRGVPIVLKIKQDYPMRAVPSALAISDASLVSVSIIASDKVVSVRALELMEAFGANVVERQGLTSANSNWFLNFSCPSEQHTKRISPIRLQGMDAYGSVISEISIPVSWIAARRYYLAEDTLMFVGRRSHFESVLNRSIPGGNLRVKDDTFKGFEIEKFKYSPDLRKVEFDLVVTDTNFRQGEVNMEADENPSELLTIHVYRTGVE